MAAPADGPLASSFSKRPAVQVSVQRSNVDSPLSGGAASPRKAYLWKDSDSGPGAEASSNAAESDQGPPPYLDLGVLAELPDQEHTVLFVLPHANCIRVLCRNVYTDSRFGTAVLCLIVANSALMLITYAWPGCSPHPCGIPHPQLTVLELFFTIAFSLEMLIKILALGYILHPRSYMRFGWNVLDFITVVASWLEYGGNLVPNASILRLLRVLRPLRTMSRVRGLRILMGALFGAMPEIRDNIVLLAFLVLIFAILGVQLFAGKLHDRCIVVDGNYSEFGFEVPFLLPTLADDTAAHCGGTLSCHDEANLGGLPAQHVQCRSDEVLPAGQGDDLVGDPLDYDNLGSAVLLILKVFTGDDWPEDMMELQNTSGLTPPFFFFFLCIMVGGLFATNLFLAVLISAYYTNARKSEEDMQERKAKAIMLWEQVRKGLRGQPVEVPDSVSPALALMFKRPAGSSARPPPPPPPAGAALAARSGTECSRSSGLLGPRLGVTPPSGAAPDPDCPKQRDVSDDALLSSDRPAHTESPAADPFAPRSASGSTGPLPWGAHPHEAQDGTPRRSSQPPQFQLQRNSVRRSRRNSATRSLGSQASAPPSTTHRERESLVSHTRRRRPTFAAADIPPPMPLTPRTQAIMDRLNSEPPPPPPPVDAVPAVVDDSLCSVVRRRVANCVMHHNTQNFIMIVTCFNVVVLAMDHYGVENKPAMASFMCFAGLACFFIFATEIALKFFGLGVVRTLCDPDVGAGYNLFDLVLVLSSVPSVVSTQMCLAETGSGGAFSAFRAFRMLRALRVLRRWPSVHALLKALVSCLSEGVYVSLLLLLQIFIFSILGMQLFENKFPVDYSRTSPPAEGHFRQNFNSLWEAALTCFVIITGDAWGAIMKRGMQDTGDAACVYFLFAFLIGNYVLVNVFVAVILDKLDAATSELELTATLIAVRGAGNGCDGVYEPFPESEGEHVWRRRGELEGPDARFLFSTGENGCWVVWHSEARGADEGWITSEDHKGKMPQEMKLWRRNWLSTDWDQEIAVEETTEPDGEDMARHEMGLELLAILGEDTRSAEVPLPAGGALEDDSGVQLRGLCVSSVAPDGPAQVRGVERGWVLDTVDGHTVSTPEQASAELQRARGDVMLGFRRHSSISTLRQSEEQEQPLVFATDQVLLTGPTVLEKLREAPPVELLGASCTSRESRLRQELGRVVHSYGFDVFIVSVIAANVVFLAIDYPKAGPDLRTALDVGDYVFTAIFFVEMVMKILAMGFCCQTHDLKDKDKDKQLGAYFRDPWNCIDCFVVVCAVAAIMPGTPDDLKVFRSLRTLRMVTRSVQLRIVIQALVRTVPAVTQGLVVCAFIFFVFAILGTQLFKGTFYQCTDPSVLTKQECYGTFNYSGGVLGNETIVADREWENASDHFDNVGNSLYTLIVVAIGEAWAPIMYSGIDAVGEGRAPELNAQPLYSLYFISFHVVGNFFCLNLIIGILISEFTNQRRRLDGTQGSELSEKQQSYIAAEKAVLVPIMFKVRPSAPSGDASGVRLRCFNAVQDACFDRVVTAVIVLNMVILATFHHRQEDGWQQFQDWGNWWCSVIFTAEAAVKLLGLGPYFYFREGWNRFDFTIVLVSLLGMFVPGLSGFSAIRVLRVGRLFRLVEHAKGLQKLFNTMFQGDNFVYFGNIGVFCLAILFMFAVAGVNLFGELEPAEGVDHNLNFHNVWNALITLFAIWTTEGWLDVRDGLVKGSPDCGGVNADNTTQGDCGRPVLGNIYAISFIVVGAVVVLNLFAAVVVELFDKQEAQERCSREIEAVGAFRDRWRQRFGMVHICYEVPCSVFVEALRDHDEVSPSGELLRVAGLLPNRLRRLPRKSSDPDHPIESEVHLPLKPTAMQLLTWVSAAAIPLRCPTAKEGAVYGNAVVKYSDAVYCLAARAFDLLPEEAQECQDHGLSRGPKIPENAFMLSHWLAVNLLVTRLRDLRERRLKRIASLRRTPSPQPHNGLVSPSPKGALASPSKASNAATSVSLIALVPGESPRLADAPGAMPADPAALPAPAAAAAANAPDASWSTVAHTEPVAEEPPTEELVSPVHRAAPEPRPLPPRQFAPPAGVPPSPPPPPPPQHPPAPRPAQSLGVVGTPAGDPRPRKKKASAEAVRMAHSKVRALLTPLSDEERRAISSPEMLETKEQKEVSARQANASLRSELALLQQQLSQQWEWTAP